MVRHYTAASQGRPKNIASNPGGYTKAFTTRCDPGWSQPSWRFDSVASKKGKIGKGYKSATANLKFFFLFVCFFLRSLYNSCFILTLSTHPLYSTWRAVGLWNQNCSSCLNCFATVIFSQRIRVMTRTRTRFLPWSWCYWSWKMGWIMEIACVIQLVVGMALQEKRFWEWYPAL